MLIAKDTGANGGFYKLSVTGSDNLIHDWGNLLVGNGDLGPVLLIDRFWQWATTVQAVRFVSATSMQ
ncbi:hypothetical protein IDZ91_06975 [Pseudomonas aeruginosa]|nr:hypothetical protein [Pseudomonas aeruginosa]